MVPSRLLLRERLVLLLACHRRCQVTPHRRRRPAILVAGRVLELELELLRLPLHRPLGLLRLLGPLPPVVALRRRAPRLRLGVLESGRGGGRWCRRWRWRWKRWRRWRRRWWRRRWIRWWIFGGGGGGGGGGGDTLRVRAEAHARRSSWECAALRRTACAPEEREERRGERRRGERRDRAEVACASSRICRCCSCASAASACSASTWRCSCWPRSHSSRHLAL